MSACSRQSSVLLGVKSRLLPRIHYLRDSLAQFCSTSDPSRQTVPNARIEGRSELLLSYAPHHVVVGADCEKVAEIAGIGNYEAAPEVLMKGSSELTLENRCCGEGHELVGQDYCWNEPNKFCSPVPESGVSEARNKCWNEAERKQMRKEKLKATRMAERNRRQNFVCPRRLPRCYKLHDDVDSSQVNKEPESLPSNTMLIGSISE